MKSNFETIKIINAESDPIIITKEEKYIAVSIESINGKYMVTFDIINEENSGNFNPEIHDYDTIGIIECYSQEGSYNDCRVDLITKFDKETIEDFKKLHF
jgi:hypothetical protein